MTCFKYYKYSSSNLRVRVHWLLWPITDSFSLSSSLPFPFSVSFSLPLSALFSLPVSVPGLLAVFPSAAVVGGRLGAPLQRQVFLSIAGNLMKHADVVINHPQIFMQMYMRYATGHVIWSAAKHHHTSCHASQAAAGKTQRAGDGVDLQKKKTFGTSDMYFCSYF